MKKPLVLGVGGVALFAGTVLGMLALQGRLNHEGTQGIPVLSSFFPAAPQPDPGHEPSGKNDKSDKNGKSDKTDKGKEKKAPGDHAGPTADAPASPAEGGRSDGLGKEKPLPYRQGTSVLKAEANPGSGHGAAKEGGHGGAEAKHEAKQSDQGGEHGAEPAADQGHAGDRAATGNGGKASEANAVTESTADWNARVDSVLGQGQFRPGRLWSFPQMEAGMTADELNDILRRAREERLAIERDRGAMVQQRRELDARERDVADRQDAVLEKLREVEQLRAKLQAEIDEFQSTVLLIRQDEMSGLQSVAKTLASVEAKSAAAVIKKWWETDEGQARALKIWTVMEADAAHAILAELDVEMIRQVLEKRLKVVRAQAKPKK